MGPPSQSQLLQRTSTSTSMDHAPNKLEQDLPRCRSVSVKLEETDQENRYLLTAEDAEILQDVLQGILNSELRLEKAEKPAKSQKRRFQFQHLEFTRQLSTFDRQNPNINSSEFHGFFTLFWLGVALLLIKVAANNWRIYGTIWGKNEIIQLMLSKDVLVLGFSDLALCCSTIFCLALQRVIFHGYLRWSGLGWIVQNIWQTSYLAIAIWWTYHRDWPWTHTVFMVLHCLAMLMKQHSYSSFNGYLSELYRKKGLLEVRLRRLKKHIGDSKKTENRSSFTTSRRASTKDAALMSKITSLEGDDHQHSTDPQDCGGSCALDDLLSLSETIENGTPLELDQMDSLKRLIEREIVLLSDGLRGQFSSTNHYPHNLTARNFCDFICLPTIVYELEYPRTERVDWVYVGEKTLATFGTIVVMIVVSQNWIYPVVMHTMRMKEELTVQERLQEFPWVLSDLLFPFMMEYLLAFYVIWECVLNALAEITQFADRGFYADWWNSVSWDQFARDWNRPVHNFLLRHVYHSSISAFHLSRVSASIVTFFLSACIHELIMLCIFRRLRGYLLIMQMSQLPLVALSRTRLMRGRRLIGNVFFWLGIFTGPSLLCSLYLII